MYLSALSSKFTLNSYKLTMSKITLTSKLTEMMFLQVLDGVVVHLLMKKLLS